MGKMNIAVFFGSRSCEHDVSIVSALQLIEAAKAAGFNVTPVYISRDGLWYTGEPLEQIETFRDFNPMTKGITRVTLDVTANAGDLWAWPPQRAGLFAKVPTPVAHIRLRVPVSTAGMVRTAPFRVCLKWRTSHMRPRACWALPSAWIRLR